MDELNKLALQIILIVWLQRVVPVLLLIAIIFGVLKLLGWF